ncbi:hypothetical protein Tco_0932773 [Tanacetum coccineum]
MDGWFSFICRCGESFNSYAKAVLGNKSVDMSGKYGTSNAGAESVGVSDCNKVYKEAGNETVMSISVDDCIDLDGKERSILAKIVGGVGLVGIDSMESSGKDVQDLQTGGFAIGSYGLQRIYKKLGGRWGKQRLCLRLMIHDDSGDCGNVTTDDNEDVSSYCFPEKTPSLRLHSTPWIWSYYERLKKLFSFIMASETYLKVAVRSLFVYEAGCSVSFMGVNSVWRHVQSIEVTSNGRRFEIEAKHYKLNIEDHDHPIMTTLEIPHGLHRGRNFLESIGGCSDDPILLLMEIPQMLHMEGNFFESRGCLILVCRDDSCCREFTIYEMMKGCYVWSVREKDYFLVINLSGNVLKYNLISKTIIEIFDIGSNQMDDDDNDVEFIMPFSVDPNLYEFIQSLASV